MSDAGSLVPKTVTLQCLYKGQGFQATSQCLLGIVIPLFPA